MYSPTINNIIAQLKKLPSVGQHTAERYVFYWLKSGKKDVSELLLALKDMIDTVKSCDVCWNFGDTSPCPICRDTRRDAGTLCIVEGPEDLATIEQTGEYKGLYHVLRGTLDATEPETLARTKIPELFERIRKNPTAIKEIITALNPDLSGEATMLYIIREVKKINPDIKTTRLARGLPMGSDLRYADEITLANALRGRTEK